VFVLFSQNILKVVDMTKLLGFVSDESGVWDFVYLSTRSWMRSHQGCLLMKAVPPGHDNQFCLQWALLGGGHPQASSVVVVHCMDESASPRTLSKLIEALTCRKTNWAWKATLGLIFV